MSDIQPPPGVDPEVWEALKPQPHRHAFTWSSSTTFDSGPPDGSVCDCGLTYGDYVREQRGQ